MNRSAPSRVGLRREGPDQLDKMTGDFQVGISSFASGQGLSCPVEDLFSEARRYESGMIRLLQD